jgi:membrane-bound lytic murein transglycosylase D
MKLKKIPLTLPIHPQFRRARGFLSSNILSICVLIITMATVFVFTQPRSQLRQIFHRVKITYMKVAQGDLAPIPKDDQPIKVSKNFNVNILKDQDEQPHVPLKVRKLKKKRSGRKTPYALSGYSKRDFLSDKYNRVSPHFKIPSSLHSRVAFWFDIYTKYSSSFEVIHHTHYPWIVYKVVDMRPIMSRPGNRWAKYHRAKALVVREKRKVRKSIRKLINRTRRTRLSSYDLHILQQLKRIPGKRKAVYRRAYRSVRSQLGQKDFIEKGVKNGAQYFPRMEEIFARYDLPVDLTRIPLVESSFNLKAVSKVGASGIWQFMPKVGRKFLKINKTVDERNSPLKATKAAAKLLLENFKILKRWPLAVTAYNHGPGGVRKAARRARSKNLSVIIKRYHSRRFSFASENFYCEFLAALHAERYKTEIFGIDPNHIPLRYEQVRLSRSLRIRHLISIVGITKEQLKLYNYDLKPRALTRNSRLPVGYNLHLPIGKKGLLVDYLQNKKKRRAYRNQSKPVRSSKRRAVRKPRS